MMIVKKGRSEIQYESDYRCVCRSGKPPVLTVHTFENDERIAAPPDDRYYHVTCLCMGCIEHLRNVAGRVWKTGAINKKVCNSRRKVEALSRFIVSISRNTKINVTVER